MMCGPQSNKSMCEIATVLADTGQHVYWWVYAGSMVSVLVFGVTKDFTFTKTTSMASFSLHEGVFDKVQPPGLHVHLVIQSTRFIEHLWCTRHCAGLRG